MPSSVKEFMNRLSELTEREFRELVLSQTWNPAQIVLIKNECGKRSMSALMRDVKGDS